LTDAIVTRVDALRLKQIFSELPRLGAAILWAISRDEAMVVEHLVSVRTGDAGRSPSTSEGRTRERFPIFLSCV
jgi:hypothetical protein